MSEKNSFKVGDRVRTPFDGGSEGTVTEVKNDYVYVKVDGHNILCFAKVSVEPIEPPAYKPKKGDRVRVVLEDEVRRVGRHSSDYFELGEGIDSNAIAPNAKHVVSIEKIEPPVVIFKPGDTVRNRVSGLCYSLGRDGYLSHSTGAFVPYSPAVESWTSDEYEKVNFG